MPFKKYFYTFIILNDNNMKKTMFLLITLCIIGSAPVNSQSLFKKVAGSMKDELLGTKKTKTDPEPACACSDAELIVSLNGGKLQIDYKEADISTMDDGSLLIKDRLTGKYYIIKDGVTTGPLSEGDKRLSGFDQTENKSDPGAALMIKYGSYISKSGEKYMINFGGKQYGPFAQIYSFVMPKSGDKFAAQVVDNIATTEAEGKKMEEEMKNAKTDQEKMDLAMQYSQQMGQKLLQSGGAASIIPKIVSNVPGVVSNMTGFQNGAINGNVKYDEIVLTAYNKINDLSGKTLIALKTENYGATDVFVNTSNTKYAVYNYGTITFSDGTSLANLFNPHLVKAGSQVYLAYMYYSPKKNAMMQCKIPW
jgi:hypothetical protein